MRLAPSDFVKGCALAFLILLNGLDVFSQVINTAIVDTSIGARIGHLTIGGYLDFYTGASTVDGNEMTYMSSSSRLNEFNVNLAALYISYQSKWFRSRIIPGYGTYMEHNYLPGDARLVEASAGFKLHASKDIWIDAGIIGSPFTNESAFSKDHLMYTRSLSCEYVPYYLNGIKLSLPISEKWSLYTYLLNGWQQISDQVKGPAIAVQAEFKPSTTLLLNGNVYVGKESMTEPGNTGLRVFGDFYLIYQSQGRWSATSCIDFGVQQVENKGKSTNHRWGQANVIGQYRFSDLLSLSGRLEYFDDPANIVVPYSYGLAGYRTASGGLCLNLKVRSNALIRLDSRLFYALNDSYDVVVESSFTPWVCFGLTIWY